MADFIVWGVTMFVCGLLGGYFVWGTKPLVEVGR